jgi:hypothetical protein
VGAGVRVSAGEGKSNDYISSARDLSHRSEMDGQNLCGLLGHNGPVYIPTMLNIFLFLFPFFCNMEQFQFELYVSQIKFKKIIKIIF